MKSELKIKRIAVVIAISCVPLVAHSQILIDEDLDIAEKKVGEQARADKNLKEITVISTRSKGRVDNLPNVISITTAKEIQERGANTIGEVFSNSPDVTVPQQVQRFSLAAGRQGRGGQESINIRGLQGNNVLLLVDGIRVPNQFAFGALSTGRGGYLDTEGFRKIEVIRGPSSTQYGSDGLAGIVSFQTFNPTDFIEPGSNSGGFAKTGYSSVNNSTNTTFGYAGENNDLSAMVLGNVQYGHQYQNQGSNYSIGNTRTASNPADFGNWYVLSKGFLRLDSTSKLGITYESQNSNININNQSDLGKSSGGWGPNNVVDSTASDITTRNRVSGEFDYNNDSAEYLQKVNVMLYLQDASVTENSYQQQNSNSVLSSWRSRNNIYTQNTKGINTTLETNSTALVNQRLTYGFDWSSTNISSKLNAAGNGSSITPAPPSIYDLGGIFLQSEVEIGNVNIIPGIRYDAYSLTPRAGNVPSNSASSASPRLGILWNLTREFRPFANWGAGFSAPTPDQALASYSNLAHGYQFQANPNLKPQTGSGIEAGMRGKIARWGYQLSAFANNYSNFISIVNTGGIGSPVNPYHYQYQNLSNVYIRGWDIRTDWAFAKGWQVNAALAYSNGQQSSDGVSAPLNTIQPLRGILGIRYDEHSWGAFTNMIWNQGKAADTVNFDSKIGGTSNQYLTPASTVINLTGYWKPTKQLTVNFNVNNIFNSTYWNWSSVQGSVSTLNTPTYNATAAQQASTSPPRNVQLSARYEF